MGNSGSCAKGCRRFFQYPLYGAYPVENEVDQEKMFKFSMYWYCNTNDDIDTNGNQLILTLLKRTGPMQVLTGGASFTARETRSRLLSVLLLSHHIFIGLIGYVDTYATLKEEFDEAFRDIDSSGTLSSILTTLLILGISLVFTVVFLPVYIQNNVHARSIYQLLSLVYYLAICCLFNAYLWYAGSDIGNRGDLEDTGPEPSTNSLFIVSVFYSSSVLIMSVVSLSISICYPSRSHWLNRIQAFRVYTFLRLGGLGRQILRLPANICTSKKAEEDFLASSITMSLLLGESSVLDKKTWSKPGTCAAMKTIWVPYSEVEKRMMNSLFELPANIAAALNTAVVILIIAAFSIVPSALGVKDWVQDYIDSYEQAILYISGQNETSQRNIEKGLDFLQARLDFWVNIQDPLFISLIGAAFVTVIWTLSFIPSVALGFKRAILELRLGIFNGPGFSSNARESEFPPWKAGSFIGCYVSTVIFGTIINGLVFFLVFMVFSYRPLLEFIWKINYLWLPAIVLVVVQKVFDCCYLKIFFQLDTYSGEDKSVNSKSSLSLIRPRTYSILEFTLIFAYLPTFALAGLMRCLYMFLIAILGVMRVDCGIHGFDSPWVAFAAVAIRSNIYDCPIFWVAIEMMKSSHSNHNCCEKKSAAYRRVRNRFWLCLMLSKNPCLRVCRKHRINDTSLSRSQNGSNDSVDKDYSQKSPEDSTNGDVETTKKSHSNIVSSSEEGEKTVNGEDILLNDNGENLEAGVRRGSFPTSNASIISEGVLSESTIDQSEYGQEEISRQ